MGVRVVSKRAGGTKPVKGEVIINIARPSILGNPFYMENEAQRQAVVDRYRVWLEVQYSDGGAVYKELHKLADLDHAGNQLALQCWCAPCACHGDVIIQAIKWINKRRV